MKSTKELARELGILRKRTLTKSSAVEGERKRAKKSNQIFSFLIVIDFESTCWQGERHRTQEIIEFPAVLLNTETGQIESEFHRYVQPQENPLLSDFCKQLTGITQEQVDEATPLFICLRQFSTWLTEVSTSKMLTFGATDGASKPTAFVTWSDWDFGVCLQYECRRKQLRKPGELSSWIDLRATYRRYYQRKPQGLNGALQELGVSFEGREHSGLDDARNTAYLAWKMICDGCIMEITKTQADAIIGRNVPQPLQKPPSNPAMKNINKNAKTPERQKITELQRGCENAKCKIGTPKQSPKNTRVEVQSTHRGNEAKSKVGTPKQSPKNTRVEVPFTHRGNDELPDWGIDEIGDDDILQYLATASPSFRNPSTTVQCVSGVSYGPASAGLALKFCAGMQAVKTPTSGKKRGVLRDITNSPSCVLITNSRSEKMLYRSPFAKSSSNFTIGKNCSSPSSNCRKALLQESNFTIIKSPAAKSTLTEKPMSSTSGIMGPSVSGGTPKNHCKQVRQQTNMKEAPTSSVSPVPKPLSKSTPSKVVGLSRICSAVGAQIAKKPHVKSPGKMLVQPPAKISSDSMALNRNRGSEQMSNLAIVKDVHGGGLNGKISEPAKGKTSSAVSLQNPQTTQKFDTQSGFNLQKHQATPRGNTSNGVNLQKPQTTPSGNTSSGVNLQKPLATPRGNTSSVVNIQKPQATPRGNTSGGVNLRTPQTTPRGSTSSSVNLQTPQTTTPRVITSVRPLSRETQVSTTNEQSFGSLNSAANATTPSTNVTSFFRTPTCGSGSVAPSSSMRKTPPMCDCGCRAKRKFVQSPGPNLGKAFFCCGSPRSRSGSGCKFFRWETSSQFSPLSSSNHQTPDGCKTRMSVSPMVQPQFNTPSVLTRPR